MEKVRHHLVDRWKKLGAKQQQDGKIYAPFGGQMEKSVRRLAARWKNLCAVWRLDGKIYALFGG
jgi:hypothetical protein